MSAGDRLRYGTRQRYTDRGEVLFEVVCPLILNGIPNFIEREDLADRCLVIELRPPEHRLRTLGDLLAEFEQAHPRILGALLDAVAHGLQSRPHTETEWLPRMADFARNAMACETTLWPSGAVRTLNSEHPLHYWSGTASELMTALRTVLDDDGESRGTDWPKTAHAVSNRVHRAELFLRKAGIYIEYTREGHDRTRLIHITSHLSPVPSSSQSRLRDPVEEEVTFEV